MQSRNRDNRFSVLPTVLGVAGYVLGLGILITDNEGSWSDLSLYLFRRPEVVVWATLVAFQTAACAALLPALIDALREYPIPSGQARRKLVVLGIVLLFLFAVLMAAHPLINRDLVLPAHHQKIKIAFVTSLIFLVFMSSLYGICSVGLAVEEGLIGASSINDEILLFIRLKETLQWFLLIAGLIVGGATLTTGALETAIASLNNGASTNPSVILLYGVFGSAVIALYYLPVYASLYSAGKTLCDKILPMEENTNDLAVWYDKRTKLEAFLGLNKDWAESLRTGLTLLAPLAGSAISLLVGKT